SQPSLILQLRDKSIPVGGPLSGGYSTITVQIDGRDKPLTINTNQYQNIEYGYATTVHKSQGATVDNAFVLQSPRMDDHLKYVAMTRHRDALNMFRFAGAPRLITPKPDQQHDLGRDHEFSHEL
ncbi:hypothetical protein VK792_19445, partial [Mesobacterium sp. TK19101]|nr:hypothetical protein [Mesobacterium sp. TK19101]